MHSLVREGRRVWPFCIECGCRLDIRRKIGRGVYYVIHYWDWLVSSKDNRGHSCSLINSYSIIDEVELTHIL